MLALTLTQAYQLTHREGKVNLRLKIVHTWQQCGSLRETARQLSISRNTVRKWVRRYLAEGEAGLRDRSRRPQRTPNRTPPQLEDQVLSLHRERGWGRRCISRALGLPEGTVRHILRRHLGEGHRRRKKRKTFYPAHWAWEEEKPFRLAQVGTKGILDKGTLGTRLWDHLRKHRLPRPVDVPRGEDEVSVSGLQPQAFGGERAVFRGFGDELAQGLGDRGRSPVARGLGI